MGLLTYESWLKLKKKNDKKKKATFHDFVIF